MRKDIIIKKRLVSQDKKYGSLEIGKFINFIMRDGERSKAERIIYSSFDEIKNNLNIKDEQIPSFFSSIIEKISCDYELRKMKFGGATYQVPIKTLDSRKKGIAMRLLVKQAKILSRNNFSSGKKIRSGTKFYLALFREMKNINDNIGSSLKQKEQLLKTVSANKAFMNLFNKKRRKKNVR